MNWRIVGSNYVEAQLFAHFVHIAIVRIYRNLFLYAGDGQELPFKFQRCAVPPAST